MLKIVALILMSSFSAATWGATLPIDVNSASLGQLMSLDGVGKKIATAIVETRAKKGPFLSWIDLSTVSGMTDKLQKKLRGQILFGVVAPVTRSMAQVFAKEPTIQEVQKRAISLAKVNPDIVDDWLLRARKAPWLPKMRAGVRNELDGGASLRKKIGDQDVLYNRDFSNLNIDAMLEWRLSDLVFGQDELQISRESSHLDRVRREVISQVTKAFFDRRRFKVELEYLGETAGIQREELAIKVDENTAVVDALTGGWFSEELAKR